MTATPILNGAASQIDRMADAPDPAQAPADGRSLADLLAFSAEYGRLIVFYGLNDRPDGDWSVFFISDPTIALATLITLDLPALEMELRRDMTAIGGAGQQQRRLDRLRRVLAVTARLLRILDHSHLSLENAGNDLARLIRREIRQDIAPRLLPVAGHTAATPPHLGLRLDRAHLASHWGLQPAAGRAMGLAALNGDWFARLLPLLEDLVETLLGSLLHLSAEARRALDETLKSGTHAPQAGLYIAFCTLFRHAQRTVNSFAGRLVLFYHNTVIGQTNRDAVPGRVYLTLTAAADTAAAIPAAVPAGTRFSAGTDADGQEITYTTGQPLDVQTLAVSALRTLRVADGTVIVDGTAASDPQSNPEAPSGVFTGTAVLSSKPPAIASAFPVFGADQAGTDGSLVSTDATLGFAVSSPALLLTGGERTVTLTLTIAAASLTDTVNARLSAIATAAGGISTTDALAQVLQGCFTLCYSTAGGWVEIPGYTVTPPAEQEEGQDEPYALSFTLTGGADALTALSATPAAADALPSPAGTPASAGSLPTVMAVFRQEAVTVSDGTTTVTVNPYGVVAPLSLSGLTAAVSVTGFTSVTLSTPTGPVPAAAPDSTTPFAPFGSPAVQNGTLAITAPELFVKQVTALSVTLTWYGLPQTSTGFQGYYQGYVINPDGTAVPPGTLFTNQTFLGAFSVANPGWWDLGAATGTTYLFRTEAGSDVPAADAPVLGASGFGPLPVAAATPPAWYDPSDSALCLSLTEPPYAFGDTLYASNVMAAALREMPAAAAAAAAAETCASSCAGSAKVATAAGLLDGVLKANTESSSEDYEDSLSDATEQAVSGLNGVALKAVNDGLSTLTADAAATWRSNLSTALSQTTGTGGSVIQRLRGSGQPDAASVTATLQNWITTNAGSIGATASDGLEQARMVLAAAGQVSSARAATAGQSQAVARPVMGAAVMTAQSSLTQYHAGKLQSCIDGYNSTGGGDAGSGSSGGGSSGGGSGTATLYYPNQPWVPSLSAVSVDYQAQAALPVAADSGGGSVYSLLLPFDGSSAPAWAEGGTVPLLAPVENEGALYIGLSGTPSDDTAILTMLFLLDGSTTTSTRPPVEWWQSTAGGWSSLTGDGAVVTDGTDGMQNSGIVSLDVSGLTAGTDGLCWLRAATQSDAGSFPLLADVSTNALTATWTGPGGAESQDTPLPAGSISKQSGGGGLPGIATITQPAPSSVGRSKATGDAYHVWIGERMRHKNRAVQAWDYNRIILADFPSLWQAAVLTAGSGAGQPPPGTVRVVVVAGPDAAEGSDSTAPTVSTTLLGQVQATLVRLTSPFVTVQVDNPVYVRIAVTADLTFRNVESPSLLEERMNSDLIAWLSPWPPTGLEPRPPDYWTEPAIAEFIRRRPYVAAIRSLSLAYDPGDARAQPHYLTSAVEHTITGTVRPRPATVSGGQGSSGQTAGTEAAS
ncbi:hypothetical protein M2352_003567 [Azospirillum fermentarium]|uniref:hypothetical protein n=1 Tax=Azospirillum fermentarium TaxID=1233114 RepID=UPI002226DE1D|nr:hypothetical protein [Azospirillum fermentarium]MCW2247933.1 hypothetical protein [Azospirillum fermentarium]